MNNEEKHIIIGPSFISMLTIVFIVLKLVGVITWAWVWVLAPIWIPIAAVIVIYIVALIIALCVGSKE